MYTLKSIVRRGTPLAAVVAMVAATVVPSAAVFADALNPLTERSLLLSSSAPGFTDTDGSGNSTDNLNSIGESYAPAGSGPNGKKTGETFTFKVSSTATVKAFTLQYCTKAAGLCRAPGDNYQMSGNPTDPVDNADAWPTSHSDLEIMDAFPQGAAAGQFQIYYGNALDSLTAAGANWSMVATNEEDEEYSDAPLTGKANYVTLKSEDGIALTKDMYVKIVFTASESKYITNPGSGVFFVKMNTYSSDTSQINPVNDPTPNDTSDQTVIDGGVTVANVMTDSIHITTKVLETMDFSVGTVNPDTQNSPSHGSCDAMQVVNGNRLNLGSPDAEYSLETSRAYDAHSYWRLSSNSSGGASVYYSGDTLRNTVGDFIKPIGASEDNDDDGGKDYSHPGTEQFGLAVIDPTETLGTGTFPSNYLPMSTNPLDVAADYADGDTTSISDTTDVTNNAQFAFKLSSLTVPVLIADEGDEVISCATAKMRYVGNIAADTPAGVYTTKINYLAAPQY